MPATPRPAAPAARRAGPRTAEGKARSALNATRHGLRARHFALLPHEDPAEFAALARAARRAYRPADAVERELVEAIVAALWRELRADRLEAEILADIAPADAGRSCGSDLAEPAHRASLAVLLRYRAQAALAVRRAQDALSRHRRLVAEAARHLPETRTNEPARTEIPGTARPERREVGTDHPTVRPDPRMEIRTNEPPAEPDPIPPTTADPPRLELREAQRTARNPLDADLLRALGRDPDLVLPVPGLAPAAWPFAQKLADPSGAPRDGQGPYRRVPHLPPGEWLRFQHLLPELDRTAPTPAAPTPADRSAADRSAA